MNIGKEDERKRVLELIDGRYEVSKETLNKIIQRSDSDKYPLEKIYSKADFTEKYGEDIEEYKDLDELYRPYSYDFKKKYSDFNIFILYDFLTDNYDLYRAEIIDDYICIMSKPYEDRYMSFPTSDDDFIYDPSWNVAPINDYVDIKVVKQILSE